MNTAVLGLKNDLQKKQNLIVNIEEQRIKKWQKMVN